MAEVERRFPDELVILGVHAPKFPAERAGSSLRAAIQRYEIEHPVFNDADHDVWTRYAVRAWPTLMFVDATGRVVGRHEGEASADELAQAVRGLVERHDAQGLLDRRPIPGLRPVALPNTPLAFPGKVLADPDRDRLFVADSGHHRVVVAALDGTNPWVIGHGATGMADGSAGAARFHGPQGLAIDGEILYVADTGNHAIRRVDLASRQVTTIAGTGRIGFGLLEGGPARALDLRSPWDLALAGGTLYVAMAGTHQIWTLDLDQDLLRPYAGTGREGIHDGPIEQAWLAQPSGLARGDGVLYVADSETSAVRAVDLPPGERVHTLVGSGLFDYGDVDGAGRHARLQHPLGVAADGGILYLADTYNHKIKRIYLADRRVESWLGDGQPGDRDGTGSAARFFEPGGLSVGGGKLYVADTNNHRIRVVDLATDAVTTLHVDPAGNAPAASRPPG
ncbi:MAG TPA: NHL domain-containing thioredoxin family protein [Thermomicrobiaceae bacterium]|nr:NHL domain-containing thioredoxin family protein [Thermomicrobiaceae bacterium]